MERSLTQIAIDELGSTVCLCGGPKERKKSFCVRCYFELPMELRRAMFKTFSEGYAEAYDEAKDFLRIHTSRLKGVQKDLFTAGDAERSK